MKEITFDQLCEILAKRYALEPTDIVIMEYDGGTIAFGYYDHKGKFEPLKLIYT